MPTTAPDPRATEVPCPGCGVPAGRPCKVRISYGPRTPACRGRSTLRDLYLAVTILVERAMDPQVQVRPDLLARYNAVTVAGVHGGFAVTAVTDTTWRAQLLRPGAVDLGDWSQTRALPFPTPERLPLLVQAFAVWTTPGDPADRVQRTAAAMRCLKTYGPGLVQFLLGVRSGTPRMTLLPGEDGRHVVAGFTEPYPLAWPEQPLIDAYAGDLAALWPYLR